MNRYILLVLTGGALLVVGSDASGRGFGVGLGLVGVVLVFAGSGIAMRDERRSSQGRHFDLTGRPTPAPPEIEAVPAPRSGT